MIIGSHVSFRETQLLSSVKEALSYGANTFMFYTGAPQNTMRKDINKEYTEEAKKLMLENNININNVICHAPYIINLANRSSEEKWNFSISFLIQEIHRCEELGVKYIVLHPGSAVGITKEEGIKNIVDALNYIIKEDDECMILLETMAGKGTECGSSIEEISAIINGLILKDKIGVCIDSCHINDAGYDIGGIDSYLDEFDKLIGLERIKCVHLNDSKNLVGTHKDRHANFGFGEIGFEKLMNVVNHPKLKDVPKILETPYIGDFDEDKNRIYPPYKFEIEMIKSNSFNPNLLEEIRAYYK
ncbi:MAG: deoxyribonuclease IV [Bacilli bacterium]|nr:deoxyribonuclease IV [Bacilli bacterium]